MPQALTLAAMALLLMGCSPPQDSTKSVFWRWFQANEARLFDYENEQAQVFTELSTQLHKVHSDLTFEFGPKEGGKREFVISAGGLKEAFPAVLALADAAPPLIRWNITKFRPRRGFQSSVKLNDLTISPGQVQFTIEPDGDKAGITLFIEGLTPSERDRYAEVGFLLLDEALGEYDVATKVGFIEFKSKSTPSELPKHSFSELLKEFDKALKSNQEKSK